MSNVEKRLVVYHGSYGCDTGCCGHYIAWLDDPDGPPSFAFSYAPTKGTLSDDEYKAAVVEWAKREFGGVVNGCSTDDFDWENCTLYDWENC